MEVNETISGLESRKYELENKLQHEIRKDEPDNSAIERFENELVEVRNSLQSEYANMRPAPRELVHKADVGEIAHRFLHGRQLEGAERELTDEMKLAAGYFPLELLIPQHELGNEVKTEMRFTENVADRADAVTTITTVPGVNQNPLFPRVFQNTVANRLPLTTANGGAGMERFEWITAGAQSAIKSEGGQQETVAMTLSQVDVLPTRISSAMNVGEETLLRQGPERLRSAMQNDMRAELATRVDGFIFRNSGTAPQKPKGIYNVIHDITAAASGRSGTGNDGTGFTRSNYLNSTYYNVNGTDWKPGDRVYMVMGVDTWKYGKGLYRNNGNDLDAIDLMSQTGTTIIPVSQGNSPHVIPAASAATGSTGSFQQVLVGNSFGWSNCIVVTWNVGRMLVDPYTEGDRARTNFVLHAYMGTGYRRIAYDSTAKDEGVIDGLRKVRFTISDKN